MIQQYDCACEGRRALPPAKRRQSAVFVRRAHAQLGRAHQKHGAFAVFYVLPCKRKLNMNRAEIANVSERFALK